MTESDLGSETYVLFDTEAIVLTSVPHRDPTFPCHYEFRVKGVTPSLLIEYNPYVTWKSNLTLLTCLRGSVVFTVLY